MFTQDHQDKAVMQPQPSPIPGSQQIDMIQAYPVSGLVIQASPAPRQIDTVQASQYLTAHGWPNGLQQAFFKNTANTFRRYFILDNSGSMSKNDGNRLVGEGNQKKMVQCARWTELGDFTRFHAGLAEAGKFDCHFRLLNGSAPFALGGGEDDGNSYQQLLRCMDASPNGGTPLCFHINQVVQEILVMADFLRETHQKVCIVIATDGESSDGDISAALRPLTQLPVWVVIRLCTDEDRIVQYWNSIDKILEFNLDILDDLRGEATQASKNHWLTYGEPLHRVREFGTSFKEFDLLDESALVGDQATAVIRLILGGDASEYPNGQVDFEGFKRAVTHHVGMEPMVWDPYRRMMRRWIEVDSLGEAYGIKPSSCGCVIS